MRSFANFRTVFSESQNANQLDAELEPTQNDHSRSFKVIRFGVIEELLRSYIQGESKKVAPIRLSTIFSLRLSFFAQNFAHLLAIYNHICVPIFVYLSYHVMKWR